MAVELPSKMAPWQRKRLASEPNYRRFVERKLLRYLLDHPAAADGAEGVRHWWLRDAGDVSPMVVRDVLDGLWKRGWLITHGETPETRIYALNELEKEAVTRFVGEPGGSGNG
jgi:hypothetical protein